MFANLNSGSTSQDVNFSLPPIVRAETEIDKNKLVMPGMMKMNKTETVQFGPSMILNSGRTSEKTQDLASNRGPHEKILPPETS